MTAPDVSGGALDPEFAVEPTLFDVPLAGDRPPAPAFGEEPSYTRRLTIRRNEALAAGTHPTSRRKLAPEGHPGHGHTCGDCEHHLIHHLGGTYHKCELAHGGLTGGPGSDVRVRWPACTAWEAESP